MTGVIDTNGEHLANWLGDGASPISAGQTLARSRRREPSALGWAGITLNFLGRGNLKNFNAPMDAWAAQVVEEGHIDSIFSWPIHPYTHRLFGCFQFPHVDKNARPLTAIKGH
jgi:hypothetical protein